jgi:hypothetical protein
MIRALSFALAVAVLGGCATRAPQTPWAPRADADLAADQAACVAEANQADLRSADGYSNGRFGGAAAAAGMLDREDIRGGAEERLFRALRDSCMMRKGWKPA